MTAYPCISLWQPFASALFIRNDQGDPIKVHETRHWPLPAKFIGKRVAIHAAKRPPPVVRSEVSGTLEGYVGEDWRTQLPRGHVIGTAILASCHLMTETAIARVSRKSPGIPFSGTDLWFGHWEPGRFAWRVDDPVLLPAPVPMLGRQGWFTVELDA